MKITISMICIVLSIVLMALPYGVAMHWGISPTEVDTTYVSYFSPLPAGYADWFPLSTAILSILSLLLLCIAIIRRHVIFIVRILLILCMVLSVLSWLIFHTFTWTGLSITVLHLAACIPWWTKVKQDEKP